MQPSKDESAGLTGKSFMLQEDRFWGGRLIVWQPAKGHGYRFNIDPVLLAAFVPPAAKVVDLGAGCGIIGLLLLASNKAARVVAVERQAMLAECVRRNAVANSFAERLEILAEDLRHPAKQPYASDADLVVFNPPYFPANKGQACPDPCRDQARHERFGTLADFVRAASDCLAPDGVLASVLPVHRWHDFQTACAILKLQVRRVQPICPRLGEPNSHVLVAAQRHAEHTEELSPLVVHAGPGRAFTDPVQRWVDGSVAGKA